MNNEKIFEELNKKIADLEMQVQNQQKMIEKLISYLGVDFSKSSKQVLSQVLKKATSEVLNQEFGQNLLIHIDSKSPSLIALRECT